MVFKPQGYRTNFPTLYQFRKRHVIRPATGAGTGYQIKLRIFKGTIIQDWYDMSIRATTIAGDPIDRRAFCVVHNTVIEECNVMVDGAIRKYLAYDADPNGNEIRLYYSNVIWGTWTPYSANPILGPTPSIYYCPSVALVNGVFQMFLYNSTNTRVERWTSTNGINFVKAEDILIGGDNPFIWLNPNDNKWYLLWRSITATFNIIARSASNIIDMASAPDVTVLSEIRNISGPSIMYRDGYYWLLMHTNPAWWNIVAYKSLSVISGYSECTLSPICTHNEIYPRVFLTADGKCYLFTNRDGANWRCDIREVYSSNIMSAEGHCRDDFGDIRFTSSDKVTLLDYWIEQYVPGSYADFWVKITEDLSLIARTIYIYYGNSGAASIANGTNTFLFFDDFSEAAVDWTGRWQSTDHTVYSIIGGKLQFLTPAATGRLIQTKSSYSGFAAECLLRQSVADKRSYFEFATAVGAYTGKEDAALYWDADQGRAYINGGSSYFAQVDDLASYFKCKYLCPSSGNVKMIISLGGLVKVDREGVPNAYTVYPAFLSWQAGGIGYADDVFVRKYVNPEPTHGEWESEETTISNSHSPRPRFKPQDFDNWYL